MIRRITLLGLIFGSISLLVATAIAAGQNTTSTFLDEPLEYVPTVFDDVRTTVGISFTHVISGICNPPIGSGSAWGDFDNDDDVDLFITNHGGANALYRNDGDTNADTLPDFTDIAATMGVDDPANVGLSANFIDYDNDGDQDLYVTNWGGNTLYQNQLIESGSVSFVDVTLTAGLIDDGRAITSAWGDFDQDGNLDVYLAKHRYCAPPDEMPQDSLYRSNGDGTFTNVSDWLCSTGTAPCDELMGLGFTAGWFDFDNDNDLDLYLINDNISEAYYPNVFWRNDGSDGGSGWLFTDVSTAAGVDVSLNGMGLGIGDYDLDGDLDVAFSNIGPGRLLSNNNDGTFADVSASSGVSGTLDSTKSWATMFFDHDNNGWLDLYMVRGNVPNDMSMPNSFMFNDGTGNFSDISVSSGLDNDGRGRSASMADFDKDGFVDLYVGNYGQDPALFHNRGDNGNNWLAVTVEGTMSNRDAIGTRIEVDLGSRTLIREISSGATHGGGDQRMAHFGLRANSNADLTIKWPSGLVENIGSVNANQYVHYVEPIPTAVGLNTVGTSSSPIGLIAIVLSVLLAGLFVVQRVKTRFEK